jgi:hypothetical protein
MAFVQIDELGMMATLIHDWRLRSVLDETTVDGSGGTLPGMPKVHGTIASPRPDGVES